MFGVWVSSFNCPHLSEKAFVMSVALCIINTIASRRPQGETKLTCSNVCNISDSYFEISYLSEAQAQHLSKQLDVFIFAVD
jgi:hypothetical protein